MPLKTYRQAINETLFHEMRRDERIVIMGEDIAGGAGTPGIDDAWGGPLGVTPAWLANSAGGVFLTRPLAKQVLLALPPGRP